VLGVIDRPETRPPRDGEVSPLAASLHGVWDEIHHSRVSILRKTTLAHLVEAGYGLQYVI
jgi:hypothetical protein